MSCTRLDGKVGDKGQRFEIRYVKTVYDEVTKPGTSIRTAGDEAIFGWAGSLEGARDMAAAVKLAPWCFESSIVDRHTGTVVE